MHTASFWCIDYWEETVPLFLLVSASFPIKQQKSNLKKIQLLLAVSFWWFNAQNMLIIKNLIWE